MLLNHAEKIRSLEPLDLRSFCLSAAAVPGQSAPRPWLRAESLRAGYRRPASPASSRSPWARAASRLRCLQIFTDFEMQIHQIDILLQLSTFKVKMGGNDNSSKIKCDFTLA